MGPSTMVDRNWRIDDSFQDEALVMNSQFVLPLITKYAMSDPGIAHKGNQFVLPLITKYAMSDPGITYKGHQYITTSGVSSSTYLESLQVSPYVTALLLY